LIVLGLHHTCSDGWSKPIFWRDLAAFYNAHVSGRPAELPELPLQFGDFAVWQRRLVESPEFQPHLDYWIERLRGLEPPALLTDFEAVLARHTGQSEIVIGTATTGRPMSELASLIGPFINVLVLRTDVSEDPTFRELLERTKQATVEAWQHRSVPFEQVVGA